MNMLATETQKHKVGRFELIGNLGRGSQGSVFLAKDPTLDRKTAIKILHHAVKDKSELDYYLNEGKHLAKLRHPNIVSLYEAGVFKKRPYLIFEYVKGQTLRKYLKEKKYLSRKQPCL